MTNLYFKNRIMFSFGKRLYTRVFVLSFVFLLFFATYSFAQTRLYYNPGNIYPILNFDSNINNSSVIVSGYLSSMNDGFAFDIIKPDQLQYPNDKIILSGINKPIISNINFDNYFGTQSRFINSSSKSVFYTLGRNISTNPVYINNLVVSTVKINNTGTYYLTAVNVGFYTGDKTIINGSSYDQISGLNIYFRAAPAVKDTVQPTFPNNQTILNNINFPYRQINRQNKNDFSWVFGLLDNSNTAQSSNGWVGEPDFDAGNNFRPNATNAASGGITNQNGINTGSFRLEIKVATGWLSSGVQTNWSDRGTSVVYTNVSDGITLQPWGKTWRWFDKNYTGKIDTGYMPDFGVEELVMISGRVEDRNMGYPGFDGTQTWEQLTGYSYRSGKNSTGFVYYFNQGMRPWFNNTTQGSYHHDNTCVLDLDRYQTGFAIRTITGFLHDDWAGVDTTSLQVVVTGTIGGSVVVRTYTFSDVSNISLTDFSFNDTGCRNDTLLNGNTASTYPGNGSTDVCNTNNYTSTGNYILVFSDLARTYDPETRLDVSISYKDKVNKDSWPVSCGWGVAKAPRFVWTGNLLNNTEFGNAFNSLMRLSNYPFGAQILPINIQLQDDWAGVDTDSIAGAISGQKLNIDLDDIEVATISLGYDNSIYFQLGTLWLNNNYPNYNNWTGTLISQIQNWQQLNYELLFAQTGNNSSFTGYFAPEHPINLTLTFDDKKGSGVSNPINVTYSNDEAPEFWEYTKTSNFTGGYDQLVDSNTPVGNYLTGEMAKLFSGDMNSGENRIYPYDLTGDNQTEVNQMQIKQTDIAFKVTDNRAGVDSGTVKVTVAGKRWGTGYTYIFTGVKLNFTGFHRGDNWDNALNYLVKLIEHNIYFDRQSRDGDLGQAVDGRESRYTITLEADDLKQPNGNNKTITFERDMENLSCQYLNRCNARLYFTYDYGSGVVPVVQTGVHPFLGQTLYVIASGNQVIYTGAGLDYIACNGAGTLGAPIDIDFEVPLAGGQTPINYSDYQHTELVVKDGEFELVDGVLVLR